MKIFITSGHGVGKSAFAEELSKKYNIPHFDLEDLEWHTAWDQVVRSIPNEEEEKKLKEILQKDDWIIEGIYFKGIDQIYEAADEIIILELPRRVYRQPIINRFKEENKGSQKTKKDLKAELNKLLRKADKSMNQCICFIYGNLFPYRDKFTTITSKGGMRKYLKK